MALNNTLNQLMDIHNISVKHLAREEGKMTDIPRNTISVIKNNKTGGIDYGNLEQLLRVLNVTPNTFFRLDPPLPAMENTVEALPAEHKRLIEMLGEYGLAKVLEYGAAAICLSLEQKMDTMPPDEREANEVLVEAVQNVLRQIAQD